VAELDEQQPVPDDAGFTLVETMVAIVLVTIAIFALSAELTAYLHHQANERARTTAVRLMTSSLENARRLPAEQLAAIPAGTAVGPPVADGGRDFTTTEVVQRCSVTDADDQCTTPASADVVDTRVRITVSWQDGGETRSVSTYASVADDSSTTYSPSGSGSLATLVGGAGQTATGVSVSAFTASPTTATVSAAGVPTSAVTLSLTTVGLTDATSSIPVTWTDDAGSHQWSLTGGPSSWTATIPASSIRKAVTSGTASLAFAATVPGTTSLSTASVTLTPAVGLSSCSVTPNPIVLTLLTRKTSLPETLTCTTRGLSASDSVTVSYPSGSGNASKALTSSDGTTWTATLSSGTSMAGSGLTETFTFTATRASDGLAATGTATAVLA
jgi:prepilin-type N-terminal cleavage/methylation domain-containing protein